MWQQTTAPTAYAADLVRTRSAPEPVIERAYAGNKIVEFVPACRALTRRKALLSSSHARPLNAPPPYCSRASSHAPPGCTPQPAALAPTSKLRDPWPFACPGCGAADCPAHDTERMTWRHLNFFQHQAYLHARVPRVRCVRCGVKKIGVPWAREGGGFTLLFEALVMALVSAMPVNAVARLVGEHDTRLWRVIHHYVERARARADLAAVTRVAIDETAARRGHHYISLFVDIDRARVDADLGDGIGIAAVRREVIGKRRDGRGVLALGREDGPPSKSIRLSSAPSSSPTHATPSTNCATTCANSKATACCSGMDPATPTASPQKASRLRCCSSSSTKDSAVRSHTAVSTTAPSPVISRPVNWKPLITAPTKPSNRSSICLPRDLRSNNTIVERFWSRIRSGRI